MKTFFTFVLGGLCAVAIVWGLARVRERSAVATVSGKAVKSVSVAADKIERPRVPVVAPGDYPEPPNLSPWLTRAGALQLKSGHVQGACVSKDAVYMSLHNGLYKFDWKGNLLNQIPGDIHQGDVCWHDGKLYVSVAVPIKRRGEHEGRIDVYDGDLNFVTRTTFVKPADGITCLNGVLYVGLGPSRIKSRPYCGSWYGTFDAKTLKPLSEPRLVECGFDVCAGVQNICNDGEKIYVQVYTPEPKTPCLLIFDRDFKLLGHDVFGWRHGFDLINWKGKPYFFHVTSVNGYGQAADGKQAPPQALVRYAEWKDGKMTDVTDWISFPQSKAYKAFYRKEKETK